MATASEAERLSHLEGAYEHLATKADIANLKVWMLISVLGGMFATATLALGVAQLLEG